MRALAFLIAGLLIGAGGTFGYTQFAGQSHDRPYADEQGRPISSLSAKDVEDLTAGRGWGLAKPAEFNGYPGPAHIIELAAELDLAADQRRAVDASFVGMQAEARRLGTQLVAAERALDAAFLDKTIDREKLRLLLNEAAATRARLREVHLAAHLEVTPLLDERQKAKYAELRGYAGGHGGH